MPVQQRPRRDASLFSAIEKCRGGCEGRETNIKLPSDFDEGMQGRWYRHIKLVERTIVSKHGTGGSLGVEFLKKSLLQPVFPGLWAIRHLP